MLIDNDFNEKNNRLNVYDAISKVITLDFWYLPESNGSETELQFSSSKEINEGQVSFNHCL